MKKIITTIILIIAASTTFSLNFLTNYKPKDKEPTTEIPNITKPNNSNETQNTNQETKVEDLISNMTLDEKIGQMMIVAYRKPNMDSTLTNILTKVKPGGFIFFKENFPSTSSAQTLISEINKTAKIPYFLSVDEEGGRVSRLSSLKDIKINTIPSMSEIGATNNTETAYNTGTLIANNLKKFGLNMDFAPVLDIYSNPENTVIGDRSFGSNAYLVSRMGISLGKGLKENNIIPVYKHFPGHGDTKSDSHVELPIVTKTKEELLASEIIPFKDAISNNAEVIMIGHLAVPSLTNDYTPASLSKTIINDFLREELGYKNLVITDALNMKAITDNYSTKQIYELAINAGVNILLMPEDPINAVKEIKELINENKINESQINTSVTKILELKKKYNII